MGEGWVIAGVAFSDFPHGREVKASDHGCSSATLSFLIRAPARTDPNPLWAARDRFLAPDPHPSAPRAEHRLQEAEMASFNKVILMGNLTRDPELRYTASNMAICKVGMAVNRRVKDQQTDQWREEPTFVDVTIFGKRGEAFDKFHKKGASAFIDGELYVSGMSNEEFASKMRVIQYPFETADAHGKSVVFCKESGTGNINITSIYCTTRSTSRAAARPRRRATGRSCASAR